MRYFKSLGNAYLDVLKLTKKSKSRYKHQKVKITHVTLPKKQILAKSNHSNNSNNKKNKLMKNKTSKVKSFSTAHTTSISTKKFKRAC